MSDKKKKLKFEKLHINKEELDDESAVLSVKNTLDTAEAIKTSAKASAKAAATTVKTVKKAPSAIKTGAARSARTARAITTSIRTQGVIKTTAHAASVVVKKTAKGSVKTAVSIGKGAVKGSANAAAEAALSSTIDKNKVTETGIESVKYTFQNFRRAENTVKTVKNTGVAARKTGRAVKKTAQLIHKAVHSKTFLLVGGAMAAILIMSTLVTSFVAMIGGVLGGTFGWIFDDTDNEKKVLEKYIKTVQDEVSDAQKDIDDVYYNFDCDKVTYGSHWEISEFRTKYFDYQQIDINNQDKYAEVIAIAAVKWHFETITKDDFDTSDMKIKKKELRQAVDFFYKFEHGTKQDYCPHYDCCQYGKTMTGGNVHGTINYSEVWYCDHSYHGCKEITEWVNFDYGKGDWDWDTIWTGSRTFCDNPYHNYLTGEVKNYSVNEVMDNLHFNQEQKDMYEMYHTAILEWLK